MNREGSDPHPESSESQASQPLDRSPAKILVVDKTRAAREALESILVREGYEVQLADNGDDAIQKIHDDPPDCILCELNLSGTDGYEICQRIKASELTRLIPFVVLTGLGELDSRIPAIDAGADDFLTKPIDETIVTARVRSLIRFKRRNDELENASNVVFALARAIEAKDYYTEGHGERVAALASKLASYVGLHETAVDAVRKGGVLHDIGKIGCPDAILNKPGPLTPEEFRVICRHPEHGWEICRHIKTLQNVLPCIRWHHEKLDGTGYPDGLGEDDIPPGVRIMSIADVYDALSTARSYKPAFPAETCFRILLEESNRGWWDKELVKAFVEMMRQNGFDRPSARIPRFTVRDVFGA